MSLLCKSKILICICHHFDENRIPNLIKLIDNYRSYNANVFISIDTNNEKIFSFINENKNFLEIKIHKSLDHPYSLATMHRSNMLEKIENFDYFLYIEDDMLISEKNFLEYLNNFQILYPIGCVPSFIRIEKFNDELRVVDLEKEEVNRPILEVKNKRFVNLTNPYHAFWILPKKELIESIDYKFTNNHCIGNCNREHMASYVMWGLNKTPYVLLEGNRFSELSYSFHLSNNYAPNQNVMYGKYNVDFFNF